MTYEMTLPVRSLHVVEVRHPTPRLARITFGGEGLEGLRLAGPDQQVKLYFPKPGQEAPVLPAPGDDFMSWYEAFNALPEEVRPWMRSYTIRRHDPERATVTVDFVLHGDGEGSEGPATAWARQAEPGQRLAMFGPSAYFAKPVPLATTDWMLLTGDETALPAITTILEALPEGSRAVAYVEVADRAERQEFATRGEVTVHWLERAVPGRAPAAAGEVLVEAVRAASFPAGSVYAWLGGEAGAVRALRRHLVDDRGIDKKSLHFSGYWRLRLTQDDAPTEADLADAQELLAQAEAGE
ncbi:siderophore-interacting protein [Streptomyces indicus]|uniref:NADPH-dependent ferric siderophore reductase, contains FAD-binding and SIP domains n=1 Tax=Streptomyces indicus TaxID=417292 RepID=A0A1G9FJT3_9ACTN|nr:siderophore-interacting protein [Streptomyces indicus]SDK88660.1 NADPH-dependent ferric siderophore reductase, contains FAD-binding and SIP domains [Streptomyces indicus]